MAYPWEGGRYSKRRRGPRCSPDSLRKQVVHYFSDVLVYVERVR